MNEQIALIKGRLDLDDEYQRTEVGVFIGVVPVAEDFNTAMYCFPDGSVFYRNTYRDQPDTLEGYTTEFLTLKEFSDRYAQLVEKNDGR